LSEIITRNHKLTFAKDFFLTDKNGMYINNNKIAFPAQDIPNHINCKQNFTLLFIVMHSKQ